MLIQCTLQVMLQIIYLKIINLVSAKFHLTILIIIDYCLVRLD